MPAKQENIFVVILYKWVISICLVSAVTSGGLEARTQVYGTVNGSGADACLNTTVG
jgi:hypothetical protein